MRDSRKIILRYSITIAAAGLMSLLVLYLHSFWDATTLEQKYKILADAFTIPGVVLVMFAALIWVSSTGFFDGLTYAFTCFGGMLIPFFRKGKEHQTYYDYKMSMKDKKAKGYSFLFFVGILFVAISVVFIALFYSV